MDDSKVLTRTLLITHKFAWCMAIDSTEILVHGAANLTAIVSWINKRPPL